jgi:hypothetical protein
MISPVLIEVARVLLPGHACARTRARGATQKPLPPIRPIPRSSFWDRWARSDRFSSDFCLTRARAREGITSEQHAFLTARHRPKAINSGGKGAQESVEFNALEPKPGRNENAGKKRNRPGKAPKRFHAFQTPVYRADLRRSSRSPALLYPPRWQSKAND